MDPLLTSRVLGEVAAVRTAAGLSTSQSELEGILRSLPSSMRSPLQLDLAAGRTNELDAIGRGLARAAAEHATAVPAGSGVVRDLEGKHLREGTSS